MKWYKLPAIPDPKQPFITKVKVAGKSICLVGYEGEIFALSAKCPHAGADLSAGWCRDGKLICPFHRYAFSLKTGKGDPGQNDYIESYPIELRDDGLYVGIEGFWEKIKQGFS